MNLNLNLICGVYIQECQGRGCIKIVIFQYVYIGAFDIRSYGIKGSYSEYYFLRLLAPKVVLFNIFISPPPLNIDAH